jgi:hypothetical protein
MQEYLMIVIISISKTNLQSDNALYTYSGSKPSVHLHSTSSEHGWRLCKSFLVSEDIKQTHGICILSSHVSVKHEKLSVQSSLYRDPVPSHPLTTLRSPSASE